MSHAAALSRPAFPVARRLLTLSLLAAFLSGCASLTTHKAPTMAVPVKFAAAATATPTDNSRNAWWLAFRDPLLTQLVERGLQQNLDIAQAVERINEANAGMIGAGAEWRPSLGTGAAATIESGEAGPVSSVVKTGNASWLLDLFGQGTNARTAARANLEAAYFSADTARLTFLSEVINAYTDLRYYQESLALTRLSLASRRETQALTQTLLDNGAGSQLDVLQAQSALDATMLQMPALEIGFIRGVNRLATLTAQSAADLERSLQRGAPQPWPRLNVNAGVPADLVRARPDIQAAERALLAASAEAGIAEAQLYPSLTLSGNISLAHMAGGSALGWSFGPTLNLPFLDGGQSRANHQIALSRVEQAYIAWQAAIRMAIEETENALAAVRRDGRSLDAATKLKDSATRQLELARLSYEAGEGPVLDVLNAERGLFDARAELAATIQQYARNFVILNTALAGGIIALGAK